MIKDFLNDKSGNIMITTALLSVPIAIAAGAAIDYSRLASEKSNYQEAADSAVLAAASNFGAKNNELRKLADEVFLANLQTMDKKKAGKLIFLSDGLRYEAKSDVPLFLMSIGGTEKSEIEVAAEVGLGSEKVEIALVLDTTGSMEPNMVAMKQSAISFVETIDDASNGEAKFAVVPFVASVNVGKLLQNSELDSNADSIHHANILENRHVYWDDSADCGFDSSEPDGGSTQEGTSLGDYFWKIFGITSAHAQTPGPHYGSLPSDWTSASNCDYRTPLKLNHFTFYSNINVDWKGCVEARPGNLDVSNDPATNDPNTKWVPYFWPDEEPRGTPAITHNHYFDDPYIDMTPTPELWDMNWGPTANVIKYDGSWNFNIDETGPDTLGPNKSCPDEMLPLNSDASIVKQHIDALSHWNDGGTVASEGVAWGMRALTPGAPLTQAEQKSDELKKVLILFGDGKNEMPVNIDNSKMITDYSAYGYAGGGELLSTGRMNDVDATPSGSARITAIQTATQDFLDERMLAACENAKAQDITILTILFNETDAQTQKVYKECASSSDKAIIASDAAGLQTAFDELAGKIMQVHLRK